MAVEVAPAGTLTIPPDSTFFSRERVERILALVVSVGCAILGFQSLFHAIGSTQETPTWNLVLSVVTFGPLALMIAAGVVGRFYRAPAAVFAIVFPLVLVVWPLATAGREGGAAAEPWIWYLLNVATVATALVFPLRLQYVWCGLVPVLYGVVRLIQIGVDGASVILVSRQVVYAIILAVVMIMIGWMLRLLAERLDRTREEAVRSYAAAAAADAVEQERISVAALMHDSVLAALIAAERASTPRERDLAVGMARDALTRLANADREAEEGPDEPVDPAFIVDGLRRAAAEHDLDLDLRVTVDPRAPRLPGRVARALVLAADQAIVNAVEHADAVGLYVDVSADDRRVIVRVVDAGTGFDVQAVPEDRLGISGSIVARTAAVGGQALVRSSRRGTVAELRWEYPR
ncbi:ATP-binding protein [Microbacterium sp. ARD31]|uniref:sensor histidine kinase n=1 Tax=Microbacterium sp. ARD31 TaxID=2962576 RepID=UPI002881902A|nr:ATP-binding protein [Microbacterium sp. ARD31]MDT0179756.1 ATP-binding protein [Microbacterium sp. ARD31]